MLQFEDFETYYKEEYGRSILKSEHAFICYSKVDGEFFIADMYVKPEFRNQKKGVAIFKEAEIQAREMGCDRITAIVTPRDKDVDSERLRKFLNAGLKFVKVVNEQLILCKDLKGDN